MTLVCFLVRSFSERVVRHLASNMSCRFQRPSRGLSCSLRFLPLFSFNSLLIREHRFVWWLELNYWS
ncbi:hypothetical protein DL95DRAFT_379263 [Leptodontidium sp. 2 PMI_412]|nr:hypothetical protein DL95DRAFT_379263 [Leptodontidium sp. 2 PMI_412]